MFDLLMADIERDLDELHKTGRMSRATRLTEATGVHFNAASYPLYFTGDLTARVVLVHLNPLDSDEQDGATLAKQTHEDAQGFVDYYAKFGEEVYGPDSDGTHDKTFDAKQVRFLRPFEVIDFVDSDDSGGEGDLNLQRVVDDKLQLELLPYGSNEFDTGTLLKYPDLLQPHITRLIDTISAVERDYVVFCGKAFDPLLKKYRAAETEWFRLRKNDGEPDTFRSRCTRLAIPADSGEFKAMLAHSYPRRGIPMDAYGEEVARSYRTWNEHA